MKIEDKAGCCLQLEKDGSGRIEVELITPARSSILGYIDRAERTFTVNEQDCITIGADGLKYAVSAKFLCEAKTFDFVSIAGTRYDLLSLRYHLLMPPGFHFRSFNDFAYLKVGDTVEKFNSIYTAMLYYCDIYQKHIESLPSLPGVPYKLEKHIACLNLNTFICNSLSSIRNYATMKKGGWQDFMHLTRFYKQLKELS